MRLHLIHRAVDSSGNKNKIPLLFKKACEEEGVEFVGYDMCAFGKEFTLSSLSRLGAGDLLYRTAVGREASTVERILVSDEVATFYSSQLALNTMRTASWYTHIRYGLPVIPSYPGVPSTPEELEEVVEKLGMLPIVIKVTGGSLGVGVMRIDSMKSLQSILDYLKSKNVAVMLRKYIEHEYYVRAVVVGDKVVASNATYVLDGEFRSNVVTGEKQKREVKVLSEDVQNMVVKSVHVLGLEAGGVDLLFDKQNNVYIAEMNFPNDFHTAQKISGVDIAKEMVRYLVNKSKNSA